jgi:hypothetical protein
MRYPPEVVIHNELYAIKYQIYFRDTFVFDRLIINNRQEQGQVIWWLDGSERFNINPMLINYERANKIRKHQNLPPLEPIGELAEESMEDISLEPAGTNTGMHQHHTYVTVNWIEADFDLTEGTGSPPDPMPPNSMGPGEQETRS